MNKMTCFNNIVKSRFIYDENSKYDLFSTVYLSNDGGTFRDVDTVQEDTTILVFGSS